MDINKNELDYLLHHIEYYLDELIQNVLVNDKDDPHYSAVIANNILKCYVDVMIQSGNSTKYTDMKSYFRLNWYDDSEYEDFIHQMEEEKKNFVGEIF